MVYNYHFNNIGSTIAITDSSQNMVNKYSYDPFGVILNQQETMQQPFKFVGQYGVMEETNNIVKMGERYYDPKGSIFFSEDPIGFAGGDANLKRYVHNRPTMLIDPLGLQSSDPEKGQFGPLTNALGHMWSNYWEMRKANTTTPGTDKFFHCMAHCQAAKEGPVGNAISVGWGETWELTDEYIINPLKVMSKEKNKQDCNEDREANRRGREGDKNTPCKETCRPYKPATWNPNYKGWQKYE